MFKQLLAIHAYVRGRFVPIIFILLNGKKTQDYVKALRLLPNKVNLDGVLTDYEPALKKAFKIVYGNHVRVSSIFFCKF